MSSNLTQHFKYNMSDNPESMTELLAQSNEFMGGGFAAGILGTLWLIVYTALAARNYPFQSSFIAANVVTTFGCLILYLAGFVPDAFPVLLIFVTGASVFTTTIRR